MKRAILFTISALMVATLACGAETPNPNDPIPTPENSVFDSEKTAYGFFPTPSEVSIESVIKTMTGISEHADVVLFQQEIPWIDFAESPDAASEKLENLRGMVRLSVGHGLEPIFVIDPLNGLNRREFMGLPPELADGNFGTPEIRSAFKNYALRVVREFNPRYIGLASEINTYMDAHPDDVENYLSLYRETYAAIKAEAPETQVFVTFQWDDLNNLGPFQDGAAYETKWEQIEAFEPQLDLWVISSYLCFFFDTAADVPADYYTPLLTRTEKPVAVAEGGCSSVPFDIQSGSEQNQIDYLRAVDTQLGGDRFAFWIYLIYNDLNMESFAPEMEKQGAGRNVEGLSYFASLGFVKVDGTPKAALAVWDEIRGR
ncbi:MAG: hypothetical protein HN855_11000 [Anaerolineae bacterium]|jgi:hypothetical protein|nr:hypothetical protein [Anaerolineae bacterium]MBT7070001.1 hypothetical protein [Anaerolineae bacterium]MBT7325679.1 hypothetical protein [Anaerolineae bacterium]